MKRILLIFIAQLFIVQSYSQPWQYTNPTTLAATNGSNLLQTSVIGRTGGNSLYSNLWLYRNGTVNDWTTTQLIDGVSIDASYQTPTTARVWWKRDASSNVQSWGDQSNTYLSINNGNVGINNPTPNYLLDINATTTLQGIQLSQSGGRWVRFFSSSLTGGAYNNITNGNDAGIVFGNTAGINTVDQGFVIVPHRGDFSGLRVTSAGNVAIGLSDTHGYKLAVAGNIITEEINVQLKGAWPDYVFESNYKLPSIDELNTYIKVNKHLPEVPSACAIEENGANLGEMNRLLLKKVEELTLYMIDQQKQIRDLKAEVNALHADSK